MEVDTRTRQVAEKKIASDEFNSAAFSVSIYKNAFVCKKLFVECSCHTPLQGNLEFPTPVYKRFSQSIQEQKQ